MQRLLHPYPSARIAYFVRGSLREFASSVAKEGGRAARGTWASGLKTRKNTGLLAIREAQRLVGLWNANFRGVESCRGGLEGGGLAGHPGQAAGPVASGTRTELPEDAWAARAGDGGQIGGHAIHRQRRQAGVGERFARFRRDAVRIGLVQRQRMQLLFEQMP